MSKLWQSRGACDHRGVLPQAASPVSASPGGGTIRVSSALQISFGMRVGRPFRFIAAIRSRRSHSSRSPRQIRWLKRMLAPRTSFTVLRTSRMSSRRAGARYSTWQERTVKPIPCSRSSFELLPAGLAEQFRPRPLGEFEIVGIIDDAAGVGVLIVDADLEDMDRVRVGCPAARVRRGAGISHPARPPEVRTGRAPLEAAPFPRPSSRPPPASGPRVVLCTRPSRIR